MNIKKQIRKLHAKFIAWRYEHEYYSQGKESVLRYLHMNGGDSDRLVVVFPACWVGGAKYDYVNTIREEHCHKIFLLDDSATNRRGNYLMGEDKKGLVISLLTDFIQKRKIEKIIFCGTSKGGTSALYFSFFIPNVDVYIGAPQYHVGTYLNNETQWPNLTSLLGSEPTEEKINALNRHIQDVVRTSPVVPNTVHLIYSKMEHTYEDHIKDMIADINKRDIQLEEEIFNFTNHSEVGKYFAPCLKEQLRRL